MSDDARSDQRGGNDQSGGGFDDWLSDEPGPATDPYRALASEDGDEDIADWMEFVDQGSGLRSQVSGQEPGDAADVGGQPLVEDGEGDEVAALVGETGEVDAIVAESVETAQEQEDDTGDVYAVGAETGDEGHETRDKRQETGDEPSSEDVTGEVDEITSESTDEQPEDDEEDTGEIDVVSGDPEDMSDELPEEPDDEVADTTSGAEAASEALFSTGTPIEASDISQEMHAFTATREHADLAESVALADDEETLQVALAAPIPGLDATVVGFEDVVEAEGHRRVRSRATGDLAARVVTGLVLIAVLAASLLWRPALVGFVVVVFVLGAGELYTALVRSGRKPIALFGFIGIIGASLGAFYFGPVAIPVAFILTATVLLLFYAVAPSKVDPLGNLALTITVMTWIGLGSFTMLIARSESYRVLIFGIVVVVAAMDVAQYFFGRALGKHQLAPWVSPKKTIEGLVAGVVVALTVGSLLHFLSPFEMTSGLLVGAVVAIFSPTGDLAMSAAKRSLGLKDMGSVLPGHGGFLDRIDGLIFVIPAAWVVFLWAGIL